jgi:hypothetical protein
MTKRILVALVFVGSAFLANAAVPTPQSIEKMLALTQAEKILDALKPQMTAMIKASMDQMLKDRKPSAEERKILDTYAEESMDVVNKELTMDRLIPLYVQVYASHFTQEEVDGMIAFYESPVGKSMVAKTPQVMQGVMAGMQPLMAPMSEKIQAAAQRMANALTALKKQAPKPKE